MIFTAITKILGGYFNMRRLYNNYNNKLIKEVLLFINRGFQHETNSYLPFNNHIDGPINFIHGTYGIFISGDVSIGENCTIYQQVTIGSNRLIDSKGFGSPKIGDNCLIGAGAKIIGNVRIGNNCRVGANAVVSKDLPDNSVIVLSSPITFIKDNMNNNIYQNSSSGWGYMKDGKFIIEKNKDILNKI